MRNTILLFVVGLSLTPSLWGQARFQEFEFPRLNRTYEAFLTELATIELRQAEIRLSSPEHTLTIRRHRAALYPDEIGGHRALVEIEFLGSGRLEADVKIGLAEGHLTDEVVVPPQALTLHGRVRLERGEDGYLITTLEMPLEVEVQIQSRLASQLFALCHQLSLVLVQIDCIGLEAALSRVKVPLPAAGETYVLSNDELSDEDRRRIDAYLSGEINDNGAAAVGKEGRERP